MASPFEQNKKHIMVLGSLFKTGMVQLPKRLGFSIKPNMTSVVLVSKNARISRPKTKIAGMESIIKIDQFRSLIDRATDSDNNPLTMAKLIGADTLENFARAIAAQHKPIAFNWAAKFGLSAEFISDYRSAVAAPPPLPASARHSAENHAAAAGGAAAVQEDPAPKQKLICTTCSGLVAYNVARFCWFNKARFGGNVFCMECQKVI